jgi:phosphoenolpyruvate synthase/pyruvate phosphate dikinase
MKKLFVIVALALVAIAPAMAQMEAREYASTHVATAAASNTYALRGELLSVYVDKGIFPRDPFVSLDIEGVGQLVELAAERGRATRPDIKLGICGEHGGDPNSVKFCHKIGLTYVSCSPYRVPVARLAAAQAALES